MLSPVNTQNMSSVMQAYQSLSLEQSNTVFSTLILQETHLHHFGGKQSLALSHFIWQD